MRKTLSLRLSLITEENGNRGICITESLRWTGTCASATDRDELLSYIKRLAEMNGALLTTKLPESRHPFLETMTAKRAEGLKPRNNIEVFDQDIKGKVVINAKLFADQREFEE